MSVIYDETNTRRKARNQGMTEKIVTYFTSEAHRDIQSQLVNADIRKNGALVRVNMAGKVVVVYGLISFYDCVKTAFQLTDLKTVEFTKISTLYESIYSITKSDKENTTVLICKELPSSKRCYIISDLRLIENDILYQEELELPKPVASIPQTQRDFRLIKEWFDDNETQLKESKENRN